MITAVALALCYAPVAFYVGWRFNRFFEYGNPPMPGWLAGGLCVLFPPLGAVLATILMLEDLGTEETKK